MIYVLVGLVLIIFPVVLILGNRKHSPVNQAEELVAPGNVSIFMDGKGNIDVISFSLDKLKRGKASDFPLSLHTPYSPASLGGIIRRGLILSGGGKNLTSADLMRSLGFYDWKEYSKGRKSVSVTCQDNEILLNSTLHRNDGSYAFRVRGFEKVLPDRLADEVIGNAVLELMKVSK